MVKAAVAVGMPPLVEVVARRVLLDAVAAEDAGVRMVVALAAAPGAVPLEVTAPAVAVKVVVAPASGDVRVAPVAVNRAPFVAKKVAAAWAA